MDIRISGHTSNLKLNARAYTYLGKLPLLSVFDRPLKGWNLFQKEALDRIVGSSRSSSLPRDVAVALAVKLESKGPVLFRQKRYGFNNEMIEVFKFRSMYTDRCDATASKLVTKETLASPASAASSARPRSTSCRSSSTCCWGSCRWSVPAACHPSEGADTLYEKVVDGYFARHKVKPGITGWAQINGWRGETDTRDKIEQRVKHDPRLHRPVVAGFDIYILAKTPVVLLKSDNAY